MVTIIKRMVDNFRNGYRPIPTLDYVFHLVPPVDNVEAYYNYKRSREYSCEEQRQNFDVLKNSVLPALMDISTNPSYQVGPDKLLLRTTDLVEAIQELTLTGPIKRW